MNCLLDTHAFLWTVFAPEKLGRKARTAISDPGNDIHLSSVTFWEISLKFALGKLTLTDCSPEILVRTAREMGLMLIAPDAEESASFYQLPRLPHPDPFDRMLVCQAQAHGLTLTSSEPLIRQYPVALL